MSIQNVTRICNDFEMEWRQLNTFGLKGFAQNPLIRVDIIPKYDLYGQRSLE